MHRSPSILRPLRSPPLLCNLRPKHYSSFGFFIFYVSELVFLFRELLDQEVGSFNGFISLSTNEFIVLSALSVPDSPLTLLVQPSIFIHSLKKMRFLAVICFPENGCRNHQCV